MTGTGTDHAPAIKERPDGVLSPPGYFRNMTDQEIRGRLFRLLTADGKTQREASQILRVKPSQAKRDRNASLRYDRRYPEESNPDRRPSESFA